LAGMHFLASYLMLEKRDAGETCLASPETRSFAWKLVEMVLPGLDSRSAFEWTEILKNLAAFDADRTAETLAQGLLADNIGLRYQAERTLQELANAHP